jgi:CHRD domain
MNNKTLRNLALLTLSASSLMVAVQLAQADERRAETPTKYAANLLPVHEVPAVSSVASGYVSIVIDDVARTISYELTFADLEAGVLQSHIHTAQPGVNGGIMVWLCGTAANPGPAGTPVCPASGSVTGVLTSLQVVGPANQGISAGEFAEVVSAIRNGVAYANVHSTKFPGGEVRGQLRRTQRHER